MRRQQKQNIRSRNRKELKMRTDRKSDNIEYVRDNINPKNTY